MLKPTKQKVILFLVLLVLIFAPAFLLGYGALLILPAIQIFWLAGFAHALGMPVVSGGGVDAFSLALPNILGGLLVLAGLLVSLAFDYMLACVLARAWSTLRSH